MPTITATTITTLQWSHGPKAVETRYWTGARASDGGFNGATARRPWRHFFEAWKTSPVLALQWSHGPKAVETLGKVLELLMVVMASMEPRPEGRGDVHVRDYSPRYRPLQWSHGPKAVETPETVTWIGDAS